MSMSGHQILIYVVQTIGATADRPVKIGNAEYWIENNQGQDNLICSIPASQIDPDAFTADLTVLIQALPAIPA